MATASNEALLTPALLAQLERLEIVSRKLLRGRMQGERRSRRKGESVEFKDFRLYTPGDDLRFVDWNTYARLDRLFLKLFQEEEDLHVYTLVDESASMQFGQPTKFRYAQQLAAALGFVGLVRSAQVKIESLAQPANKPGTVFRGRASLWRLLAHIEQISPQESVSLLSGVKNFCLRNRSPGVVVLVTDLLDKQGFEAALRLLVAQQMDVHVIQVLSAEEIDPTLQGDLKLLDCEDADFSEVSMSAPLLKRYKSTLAKFVHDAQTFCRRRGMTYTLAQNQTPVDQLIASYLRQQGLVR